MTGKIKTLMSEKQFGFILGESGQEYFFHKSGLKNCSFNDLVKGQEVTFEEQDATKGPRAEEIYV